MRGRSFWAPEVLLFGPLYQRGRTRYDIDILCESLIRHADPVGPLVFFASREPDGCMVDTGKPRFWSPKLPECPLVWEMWVYCRRGGVSRDSGLHRTWDHPPSAQEVADEMRSLRLNYDEVSRHIRMLRKLSRVQE